LGGGVVFERFLVMGERLKCGGWWDSKHLKPPPGAAAATSATAATTAQKSPPPRPRPGSTPPPEDHDLVRLLPQLALDEPQQVLLVHARGVVDVGVDLAHVVKVPGGGWLVVLGFAVLACCSAV
jgi:hypothetical protein